MIPLEDHPGDVVGKALRGWRLGARAVAQAAGIGEDRWGEILDGSAPPETYRALAPHLHLHPENLVRLLRKDWPVAHAPEWFQTLNLPYEEMSVNVHLAWDPETREAVVFDAAGDAGPILGALRELELKVRAVLLTHEHPDHVDAAPQLERELGVRAEISSAAPSGSFATFDPGCRWSVGRLSIRSVAVPGHSRGGTTFVLNLGSHQSVAVVGDALFAGSVGGSREHFPEAIAHVRERILTLPGSTCLAPGHGPLTTVETERRFNPVVWIGDSL